jgi:hypothetical protein
MTTKTNIDTVAEKLLQVDAMDKSTAIVLDLVSNVVHRYKQCGDSLFLFYHNKNGFNMGGREVTVVSEATFKEVFELIFPLNCHASGGNQNHCSTCPMVHFHGLLQEHLTCTKSWKFLKKFST